jgi:hypothetical protein
VLPLRCAGRDLRISCETVIHDSGKPDEIAPHAIQHAVQDLPYDTLGYLLGSRYCETQLLADEAWRLFGQNPLGWARVQAVCDFVQEHLHFDYKLASPTRTAAEAYHDRMPSAGISRPATAPGIWVTSACCPHPIRWTSPAGSRPTSDTAGTRSMHGTISHGSAGSRLPTVGTPATLLSPRHLAPTS